MICKLIENELHEVVPTKDVVSQIRQLWKDCFHDSDAYSDFYFDWKLRENTIYVIEEESKIVSMLHLNPYQIRIGDSIENSYYIVGVATNKAYRRRGLMRRLLTAAMSEMKAKGISFTYLMPASESIYTPYDFRCITRQKQVIMTIGDLIERTKSQDAMVRAAALEQSEEEIVSAASMDGKQRRGKVESAEAMDGKHSITYTVLHVLNDEEVKDIVQFANGRFADTEDVYTVRDTHYYRRMIAELHTADGDLIVVRRDGNVIGYGAYAIENGLFYILELLYVESEREKVLETVMMAVASIKNLSSFMPMEDVELQEAPMIMARILNVDDLLSRLRSEQPIELTLQVTDPILVENTGKYHLILDKESCIIKRIDKEFCDLSLDIAALTEFCFGRMSVEKVLNDCMNGTNQLNKEESEELSSLRRESLREKLECIHTFSNIHINEIV